VRLLLGLAVVPACVPFALPPVTGDVGVAHNSRTGIHADVGFAPLQLSSSYLHRPWDATLSGSFDRITHDEWGLAVAGGPVLHPWGDDLSDDATNRLLPQLVGRLTTDGTAVGARVAIEHSVFTTGANGDDKAWVSMHGETAFGLYFEADYVRPDAMPTNEWSISFGLTLRTPALVGVSCCLN
jgi:hypothetical protein